MGKRWTKVKKFFGGQQAKSHNSGFGVVWVPGSFLPQISFFGDNLDRLYEAAVWSYACISGNAGACGSLRWIVQESTGAEGRADWTRIHDHPLEGLIDQPFALGVGLPDWASSQITQVACLQLDLTGDNYWRILQTSGARPFLEPIHPNDIEPEIVNGRLSHYRWFPRARDGGASAGPAMFLSQEEVIHISHISPGSLFHGHNPTRAANRSILIDQTAHERQKANLENKISPGMVITVNGAFGPTQAQRDEIEKYVSDNFTKATQDGRPLIVGEGSKVEAFNPQQLDYFDTRRMSRDEMLAVYKTPPPIVGVYDQATLQNFDTARKIWWSTALFPRLNAVLGAFNSQLIRPRFGDKVRLWYDTTGTDIGLQLLDQRLDVALKYQTLGYPTNAINNRLSLGMPDFEELALPNTQLIVAGRETGQSSLQLPSPDVKALAEGVDMLPFPAIRALMEEGVDLATLGSEPIAIGLSALR